VKAVDGMVYEQQQILSSFILGVAFFVLQEVGMFFIVMDQPFAIVCSLIVLAGMGTTYHYALRIYNRFNWNASIDHWKTGETESHQDMDPAQRLQDAKDLLTTTNKKKKKDNDNLSSSNPLHDILPPTFAAYLTLKVDDRKEKWQRHFFVVHGACMSYFRDRNSHQNQPTQPLNSRPIELHEFSVVAGAAEPPYLITLLPLHR